MKVTLSSRQTQEYLRKADEIKVEYRDRKSIPDLAEEYPRATVILECGFDRGELDWKELKRYNTLCRSNFMLCLASAGEAKKAREEGIKFYFGFPILSYYELNAAIASGVSYARISGPLFFDLENVKAVARTTKLRVVPNIAYMDGLERENGIHGMWIRPEDIDAYDEYISAIEFEDCDTAKEQALYRIYKEQKEWSGDLKMLITNLDREGVNRMIPSAASRRRITCRQACESGGSCHICDRMLMLANPELIKDYKESLTK